MASLYTPTITNEQLLNQIGLRHRKFNLDYEYTSSFQHNDLNLLKNINWNTVDFKRAAINALNPVQGIYMFTFDPYKFSLSNHEADLVLYIGQAANLQDRLSGYFDYVKSKKAADQEKRMMILFWGDYLKLKYYQTPNLSVADLDNIEYSLIDSILPPFNLKIRSQFAQAYRRLLR
jgi:hypothetical protein